MKRFFCLLFIVMCLPLIVQADSSGPSIIGYDAIVINKKGAKIKDENDIIPYNTKIHVYNEYDNEASVCYLEYAEECYSNSFNISIKDIAVLKSEVFPKDLDQKDNDGTVLIARDSKVLIANEKGIKLRKGPAEAYGYYDKIIAYKTILKYSHAINQSGPGVSFSWYYIDDGEYKGWVERENVSALDVSALTFADITVYDENKNPFKISKETELNTIYSNHETVYIEYNDTLTTIDRQKLLVGYKSKLGYLLTIKNIEVQSHGKTITAIPKGEKIKIVYADRDAEYVDYPYHNTGPICIKEDECYYYVEYNGAKGFIKDDGVISLFYEDETKSIKFDHELEMYDISYSDGLDEGTTFEEYSAKHKLNKIVPANTTVTVYMNYDISEYDTYRSYDISLIKYGNNLGWIITKVNDDEESSDEIDVEKENKTDGKDKVLKIIIYSLIGASILSLTALVTIKLINKKKLEKKKGNIEESQPVKKKNSVIKKNEEK